MTAPDVAAVKKAIRRLRVLEHGGPNAADTLLVLAHVADVEARNEHNADRADTWEAAANMWQQRALAAEARAEKCEASLRRCERWFTAYLAGREDGQYEAGSILPAIRAALTEGSGES